MKHILIYILVSLLIISLGYNYSKYLSRPPVKTQTELPEKVLSEVVVTKGTVVIKSREKADQTIYIPKSGKVVIRTNRENVVPTVEINKASWIPSLASLAHVGISVSSKIEPMFGIQLIRQETFRLGISLNITPSMVGISLDRDILDNASIGLMYGYDRELLNRIALHLSLYI